MPVSGQELATLDFGNLIGAPLNAVVEAQAKSAISTTNFIKQVGFTEKNGKQEVVNATFKYSRVNADGEEEKLALKVPLLTMVPIPYVAVTEATVEFNAKITSVTENKETSDLNVSANVDASASAWFVSAKLNSKTSYQKKSASDEKQERTFDMRVRVVAQSVDMPSGTERLLTLLEQSINEKRKQPPDSNLLSAGGKSVNLALENNKIMVTDTTVPPELKKGASIRQGSTTYVVESVSGKEVTLNPPPSPLDATTFPTGAWSIGS